eukprot:TRINITY_DN4505_c0_g2_i1.p1 TRINITY_DN4505_c0_g2~~TRINITY_DN4505_c0_g2_i1.p1  ORF type:complete len:676 (-),score=189.80 TRINITY_DN4505_c0_g2_i1:1095-3122(-)
MLGTANPATGYIPPSTGVPRTSLGTAMPGVFKGNVQEGNYTQVIYGMIRDQKYLEAIRLLQIKLQQFPRNRAALSLLAYCHYMMQDYNSAYQLYEKLVRLYPQSSEYRLYFAQSLNKAAMFDDATKTANRIDDPQMHQRVLMLQANIHYQSEEIVSARSFLDQCIQEEPDVIVNQACLLLKEERYEEARIKFTDAMNASGYDCGIAYNIALCYYREKQYGPSLKHISDIIEKGVKEHPELGVGSNTEGIEIRSVGNTRALQETSLIEAFNLKAAIEYQLKNMHSAKEALSDMPPRSEDELDPVTLHNQALMHMEEDANTGFRKFNFLISNPPFPPETFGNLLLLYIKHDCYDVAADVLAENNHLTYKYLSEDLYEFIDASITVQTSPEEAYRKFELLTQKHIATLRKFTKGITDARNQGDQDSVKESLKGYDEALEQYIPVHMAQCRIYWDRQHYEKVEALFRQSSEFCMDHDVWKLNVAHVFFLQEGKYQEAIRYYEPIVNKHENNLLDVTAIILANLCVSYIMIAKTEDAEELMKKVEREEERMSVEDPEKQCFHLCIINLVIGTLYCAKGNYEFGISRVMKSLEPFERKLGCDTWHYTKRSFLGLAEGLAKHIISVKDQCFQEILSFLDSADTHGKNLDPDLGDMDYGTSSNTISYEARLLKKMFLALRDNL